MLRGKPKGLPKSGGRVKLIIPRKLRGIRVTDDEWMKVKPLLMEWLRQMRVLE